MLGDHFLKEVELADKVYDVCSLVESLVSIQLFT